MEKPKSFAVPNKQGLSAAMRSAIISVGGKVLHIIFSGGSGSLEEVSRGYMEKADVDVVIDADSKKAIEDFKTQGKGIIISNHTSGVFSDYLPLFAELGDDILKKTIIYTGAWNLAMNQREFGEYQFRSATLKTRKDVTGLIQGIKSDIEKINKEGGYIFMIPAGVDFSEDAEFKAIFQRMVRYSDESLPILVNHVTHDGKRGYKQIVGGILEGDLGTTTLSSKLSSVSEWKGLCGSEMRKKYNTLK